jgi:hypothetical protein
MELALCSRNRMMDSFYDWEVPSEFAETIYNYLVHGWKPGSFFTAVLANDFVSAMGCSHPGNSVNALKSFAKWIVNAMPKQAWGSYTAVDNWCDSTTESQRREILERYHLIFSSKEEVWLILKDGVDTKTYHGEL